MVPEAADACGQLLGPEDAVGDVEERVRRRRGSGRDGAASGAALRPERDCLGLSHLHWHIRSFGVARLVGTDKVSLKMQRVPITADRFAV